MSRTVISVEHLSKEYVIGGRESKHETFRDMIVSAAAAPFRRLRRLSGESAPEERIWALKDVNFELSEGDVLGIIGHNGAGKSTLLKILSRIVDPTEGLIEIRGRVSSLLEVGTGFHPELTGRENIYLNGTILGMSQVEIDQKFDAIVDFSGVERFLDTPVKRYSSGMSVRLAFAVAAHLEPDILIVDEVLAVGDAEFQRKCIGKMAEVAGKGRTILFVSHNTAAIQSFCKSAIWLRDGVVCAEGDSARVIGQYISSHVSSASSTTSLTHKPRAGNFDGHVTINQLVFTTPLPLTHDGPVSCRIEFSVTRPVKELAFGLGFSAPEGYRLLTYESDLIGEARHAIISIGDYATEFTVEKLPLPPDLYFLDIGCRSGGYTTLDYIPQAIAIEVAPGGMTPPFISNQHATVQLPSEWSSPFKLSSSRDAAAKRSGE
jgi:lipopolysaccharide transport system ATP-binding protein